MHPALHLLIKLRRQAQRRRMLNSLKTMRGALLVIVSGLFFSCMVLPNLILPLTAAFTPEGAKMQHEMIETARPIIENVGPPALALFALLSIFTSLADVAIYFPPAEVDFLFAAPFSRRELLIYKLRQSIRNAIFGGTVFMLAGARFAPSLLGAWLGFVLALLFLNALTLTATLLGQLITERAYTQSRRMILAAVVVLAALALWQAVPAIGTGSPLDALRDFRESTPGRVLLAPFAIYPRIVAARSYTDIIVWSSVGTLIVAGLYLLAINLDVNYLETAQSVSQRVYQRLQQRRSGGGSMAAAPIRGAQRLRLPRLPWLYGVGPNLWRQGLLLLRRSQGLLFLVVVVLLAGSGAIYAVRQAAPTSNFVVPLLIVGGLAYQSMLAALQLPTGFRGDLDRLDWLKSLPLHPAAIVCGQIAGAATLLSLLQAAILLIAWVVIGRGHAVFIGGLVLLLPVNWLLFGIENLVFLVFPYRQTPTTAGDIQFMGKFLLLSMLKLLLSLLGLAVAAAGAILYLIVPSLWLPLIGCLLLLLAIDVAILFLATLAYQRFDISLHTPA